MAPAVIIRNMEQRLQKIMAQAGLGSRRECETIIANGRVKINGQIAILGAKADPEIDQITIDGSPLGKPAQLIYIALHKPRGVLSTVEAPDPRPTVRDLINVSGTIYPVGRLDVDSEGLILLTNDGELANRLTHPRYGHEKEYKVLVGKHPDPEQLKAWKYGIVLEDGVKTSPAEVSVEATAGKGAWMRVILREGRKHQIKEMGSKTGLPVIRIIRIRIGTLLLGLLKPKEWRYLSAREIAELKQPVKIIRNQPTKIQKSSILHKVKPAFSKPSTSSRRVTTKNNSQSGLESKHTSHSGSKASKRRTPL